MKQVAQKHILRYFSGTVGLFFVQMADRLSCEISTSNSGARKKDRKKDLKK